MQLAVDQWAALRLCGTRLGAWKTSITRLAEAGDRRSMPAAAAAGGGTSGGRRRQARMAQVCGGGQALPVLLLASTSRQAHQPSCCCPCATPLPHRELEATADLDDTAARLLAGANGDPEVVQQRMREGARLRLALALRPGLRTPALPPVAPAAPAALALAPSARRQP